MAFTGEDILRLYRCHKEVRAFKIETDRHTTTGKGREVTGEYRELHGVDGEVVRVSDEYMDKHNPKLGGYYVRYADGYESFSPADAFEGGYTLVTKGGPTQGQVAFDAYNDDRGGVNHLGNPTPPWGDLPEHIRDAWEAAAAAVSGR